MSAKAFQYNDMPQISYGTSSPVFIVGMSRSGTSLLVQLIRKYFNINFGTESQFIVHYVMSAQKFGRTVCQTRFHEIRYEALVQDPVRVMTDLVRFVQIEEGFQDVVTRIKQQIHEDLLTDNVLKWKKGLTQPQIQMFEKGAGELLESLGYEVHSWDRIEPTLIERSASYIDNVYRRYTNKNILHHELSNFRARIHRP